MLKAGQRLKEERLFKGLTLEDVEKKTKIKKDFLIAIEKSEYNKLPSSSYAHGFVRNYAEFLGLPVGQILGLFRREFDTKKAFKVLPDGMVRGEGVSRKKFRIHGKMLIIVGILMLLASFIAYQFRYAFLNPPLFVSSPAENAVTSQDLTITGQSDPNAIVTVNNEPVALGEDNKFMKKISLFPGKAVLIIKAKSSYGKETIVQRNIEVKE